MLTIFAGSLLSRAMASDRWETLRAINWVENPTNHTRYGPKGELGPYQFRRDTWRMHSRKPFAHATNRTMADEVAVVHYEWIKRQLADAGVEPSAFNIALAWNCGVNAVISGRAPTVSYHYAERVANLVDGLKNRERIERIASTKNPAPSLELSRNDGEFAGQSVSPRFVLVMGAPKLVIAGEKPRYALPDELPFFTLDRQPRFAALE